MLAYFVFLKNPLSYLKVFLCFTLLLLVTACGGSESDSRSNSFSSDSDATNQLDDEDNNVSNSDNIQTNNGSSVTNNSIEENVDGNTVAVNVLRANLELTVSNMELQWSDVRADRYRVLVWRESDLPYEYFTQSIDFSVPGESAQVGNFVLVEAIDQYGNALFSQIETLGGGL